jgi:hypothetical protein
MFLNYDVTQKKKSTNAAILPEIVAQKTTSAISARVI